MRQTSVPKPVIIVAVGVIIVAVGIFLLRPNVGFGGEEPTFKNKTLSDWIGDLTLDNSETNRVQAREALRQIGTNAIPFLMKELQTLDNLNVKNLHLPQWEKERQNVNNAFKALGPIAEPAIPSLIGLVKNGGSGSCSAAHSLAVIGPNGVYPLVQALTNGTLLIRICIAQMITDAGTNAGIAVPALVQCLTYEPPEKEKAIAQDKELVAALRGFSAQDLGVICVSSEIVVPALIKCLKDEDMRVRFEAIRALGKYGNRAQSAIPAIKQMLAEDPNQTLRSFATNTLQVIK